MSKKTKALKESSPVFKVPIANNSPPSMEPPSELVKLQKQSASMVPLIDKGKNRDRFMSEYESKKGTQ